MSSGGAADGAAGDAPDGAAARRIAEIARSMDPETVERERRERAAMGAYQDPPPPGMDTSDPDGMYLAYEYLTPDRDPSPEELRREILHVRRVFQELAVEHPDWDDARLRAACVERDATARTLARPNDHPTWFKLMATRGLTRDQFRELDQLLRIRARHPTDVAARNRAFSRRIRSGKVPEGLKKSIDDL